MDIWTSPNTPRIWRKDPQVLLPCREVKNRWKQLWSQVDSSTTSPPKTSNWWARWWVSTTSRRQIRVVTTSNHRIPVPRSPMLIQATATPKVSSRLSTVHLISTLSRLILKPELNLRQTWQAIKSTQARTTASCRLTWSTTDRIRIIIKLSEDIKCPIRNLSSSRQWCRGGTKWWMTPHQTARVWTRQGINPRCRTRAVRETQVLPSRNAILTEQTKSNSILKKWLSEIRTIIVLLAPTSPNSSSFCSSNSSTTDSCQLSRVETQYKTVFMDRKATTLFCRPIQMLTLWRILLFRSKVSISRTTVQQVISTFLALSTMGSSNKSEELTLPVILIKTQTEGTQLKTNRMVVHQMNIKIGIKLIWIRATIKCWDHKT